MEKENRLEAIYHTIYTSSQPVSGSALAKQFHVSRQVIVQDIALLKAQNHPIYSTHKGYVVDKTQRVSRIFHVYHTNDQMEAELNAIVDCGGRVDSVYVEHDIYGKLTAPMSIASRKQVRLFMDSISSGKSRPLTDLTSGYHSHLVSAECEEDLDSIEDALKKLNFLKKI